MFKFLKRNKNVSNDNGKNQIYYDDGRGSLYFECNKINGNYEGEGKYYYSNGGLIKIENYKNGILDGETRIYNGHEEVREILNFEKGVRKATDTDIELLNKFENIKDFILEIRKMDLNLKISFFEILKMSNEDIDSTCKMISEKLNKKYDDVFYYLTYKRIIGINKLLNPYGSDSNEQNLTKSTIFKNIDLFFQENLKKIILDLNEERTFFDQNGVYIGDSGPTIRASFTPSKTWLYWRDNHSDIRDIYVTSRYNFKTSYLSVNEYCNHLKKTKSNLFYLKPQDYFEIRNLLFQNDKSYGPSLSSILPEESGMIKENLFEKINSIILKSKK